MELLFEKSIKKISQINYSFERFLLSEMNAKHRLISITGARGVGKTTMVLQFLKKSSLKDHQKLYVSLDDLYFAKNTVVDVVAQFVKLGGKLIVLDEVHKYINWSIEIKNIYDDYPDLQIVFTGSSILEIKKGDADLSRRAVEYSLPIMSLREFAEIEDNIKLPTYKVDDIIAHHLEISKEVCSKLKPIFYFKKYVEYGAYPFYRETYEEFPNLLLKTVNTILETDLPAVKKIDYSHIVKLKKLLLLISENVPFKPNISDLSSKIGITRDTILNYLDYLQSSNLITQLTTQSKGFRRFEKPDKIYLNNTNQLYAITPKTPDTGTLRETFFLQSTQTTNNVNYTTKGDFIVDDKYIFEVGGKNKTYHQIADIENSYIAADDIEFGIGNKIPLWLFGFLY